MRPPSPPAPWTRDLNKRRLEHEAELLELAWEMGREQIRRQGAQCRNLKAACEAMREMVEQMDDEDEVERLAGGPVEMARPKRGRRAA